MKYLLSVLLILNCWLAYPTNYYVSNAGNDSQAGTSTSTSWQTLSKVNTSSFTSGDSILFKRGDTFYGSFTINENGTSGANIVLGAYGSGDIPTLSGFTLVTSWTDKGSNIWESTSAVSTLTYCGIVTIGDVNTPMGRYPKVNDTNTGYLTFQSHTLYTSITSSDLTGTPDWTGAEVVIRSNAYKLDRDIITSQSGSTLNYNGILNNPQDGSGFFLQADVRCCTQQNEWVYNISTKKLSIYSTTQPSNLKVSSVEKILTIEGNYITVENLKFIGANGCGIYANNGTYNNLIVKNCTFSNIGSSGMYVWLNYLTVTNCTFSDCNNNSISTNSGHDISIQNSSFKNIGIYEGMKDLRTYPLVNSNVEAMETYNYTFQYNNVETVGYDGINFYGYNVNVNYNYFYDFCHILNDGGAIYTYTGGRTQMHDVKILNNICLYSRNTANGTSYPLSSPGIYLDYASGGTEIGYNSIANTYRYGIYISSGGNVYTHNNNVFNASEYQLMYMIDDAETTSTTDKVRNNKFVCKYKNPVDEEGNYWGFQKSLVYVAYTGDPDSTIKAAANDLDSNCYARPIADDKVVFIDVTTSWNDKFKTIAEWQSWSGQDFHSYGSPQVLTDTSHFNFVYNKLSTQQVISLSNPSIDMKGVKYNSSITLPAFSSAILMKDYNPSTPTTNSGRFVRKNNKYVTYKGKLITK